jgi:multiple sugar transport system permease protein
MVQRQDRRGPGVTTQASARPPRGRGRRPGRRRSGAGAATLRQQEARLAYGLLVPGVLVVLTLVVLPVLWNISLSLRRLRLIELRNFNPFELDVTFRNYQTAVAGSDFLELLGRTFLYALLGTSLAILMGVWAGIVLRRPFRGRALVRGLLLFPYVVPAVAAAFLWKTMLNPQIGVVNAWSDALLGTGNINFLTQRSFTWSVLGAEVSVPAAFSTVILFEAWRSFPFVFIFVLARLQAMSSELEEAAMIDGASIAQRFRYVILPQLKGVIAVLFVLRFIWTFNSFDEIFLLTGGAAGTEVVSVRIFNYLFGRSDVGAASALSIVLAVTLFVMLAVYFRYFFKEEES